MKNRNLAVKTLKKGGKVWVNTWSQDCDGCWSQGSDEIKSVQDIIDFEKAFDYNIEWADGPMNYSYVFDESEALPYLKGGSW
jgi:hypothetical protein